MISVIRWAETLLQLMSCNPTFWLLILGKHLVWIRPDGHGGSTTLYYDDEVTWLVAALALSWLTWWLVSRYLRARALRRRPRRVDRKLLERILRVKSELSSQYLRSGFSGRIHAVGVGLLDSSNEYCIQVFINDAKEELWAGAGGASLPNSFRGVPVVPIEMPAASFIAHNELGLSSSGDQYPNGIRERCEVIIGGISGANSNLAGQSGTIGYFCTRRSKLPRRKDLYLISCAHVFADLRKAGVNDQDLIMQPSTGEPASSRPIGTLVDFSALKFDDSTEPNHVDAAIAKLSRAQTHEPVIPLIGAVKGYVGKSDLKIGEPARKFGRTTGYSEGRIFSIYLDIWIKYDRTGQSAFFQNQILIEPCLPDFAKFVSKGDSGSLVVDAEQNAIGLIFAGMSEAVEPKATSTGTVAKTDVAATAPKRVEGYGVANPISEVLERLKIDLLV
jgi:hypothetical protein